MGQPLLKKFRKYVRDHALMDQTDRVLLAVSGGVDSMVLASLMAESGYDFAIAHCNFQLRGEESFEDELLVKRAAESYGAAFYNIRFDTLAEMERTGESVQMAARRLRYEWFADLCGQYGYDLIAIAHQSDDSIETFFINLFRGTGLRGLTGISSVSGRVVRPMLFATRKEIADYAGSRHIEYREDSSNRSTKYLRNKIRLGLIPRMKEISPTFAETMSRNVDRLTDTQVFINRTIDRMRAEVETVEQGCIVIDTERLDRQYPLRFVIFELMSRHGFRGEVTDSVCRSLEGEGTGKRFYGRENVAYIDRKHIIIEPVGDDDPYVVTVEKNAGNVYFSNSALSISVTDVDAVETLKVPESIALLDSDKLQFPLTLRRWTDGDSFMPLGMSGRKKVSDFLVDAKVPLPEKKRQFVLLNGEDIVWLVGRRIDERYKVTQDTETVLRIVKEIV